MNRKTGPVDFLDEFAGFANKGLFHRFKNLETIIFSKLLIVGKQKSCNKKMF